MNIIALDTSTPAFSIALACAEQTFTHYQWAPREHANLVLPCLETLLQQAGLNIAEIDLFTVTCGPGSFTGLRIGLSIAQALAFAHAKPVVPLSSLLVLAYGAYVEFKHPHVLAGLDARMQEVYWGAYEFSATATYHLLAPEQVIRPNKISFPKQGAYLGVGSAWETYGDSLSEAAGDSLQTYHTNIDPQAKYMLPLAKAAFMRGDVVSAERVQATYLRDKVTG